MRFTAALRVGLCALVVGVATTAPGATQPPAADAAAVEELGRRVAEYAELHRRIEGPVPTIKVSSDPAEIRRAVDALGSRIRKARASARRGDIFSPEITAMLRRRIESGCGGDYESVRAAAHEELGPIPAATVNGKWPGPVMPVNVLCQLPSLPTELEYRFVNRDIVLWDVHADLVVDIIPNALPARR